MDGLAQETESQSSRAQRVATQIHRDAGRAELMVPLSLPLLLCKPSTCVLAMQALPLLLNSLKAAQGTSLYPSLKTPVKYRSSMWLISTSMVGYPCHLKKSTAMSRSSSRTTANLASYRDSREHHGSKEVALMPQLSFSNPHAQELLCSPIFQIRSARPGKGRIFSIT